MAEASPKMEDVRLEGKTVIITGGNTGIGKETAREMAKRGGRVIMACRNQEKGEAARKEIVEDTKNENVVLKVLDLASLKSIKAFADDINENESRIDILVNNAGVMTKNRSETEDGYETMIGVNHLGHFYLTNLLLDKIKASTPSRVVILSSMGHKWGKFNFNDIQSEKKFSNMSAYSRSKTANILHGVQLAANLKDTGVTVYSVHPGFVTTGLARELNMKSFTSRITIALVRLMGEKKVDSPEGAKTSIYCCLEPSLADKSGKYYVRSKEAKAKGYAMNPETAKKLWDVSQELIDNPPAVARAAAAAKAAEEAAAKAAEEAAAKEKAEEEAKEAEAKAATEEAKTEEAATTEEAAKTEEGEAKKEDEAKTEEAEVKTEAAEASEQKETADEAPTEPEASKPEEAAADASAESTDDKKDEEKPATEADKPAS